MSAGPCSDASHDRHGDGAFTLTELLIATAILGLVFGLLAAIVVQFYQATTQGANQLAALRDLAQAEEMLARDVNSAATAFIPDEKRLILTIPDSSAGATRLITYTVAAPLLTRDDGTASATVARRVGGATAFGPKGSAAGGGIIDVSLQTGQGPAQQSTALRLALRAVAP